MAVTLGSDDALRSLDPNAVLTTLDLEAPGLETAKAQAAQGERLAALSALRAHYRAKYPPPEQPQRAKKGVIAEADNVVNHVFQWGPYERADYGDDIDWEWDPAGDIEWVAAVYRFHWAEPLAQAYLATRDDKYVQAFVDLTTDWIAKHPLEKRGKVHPVYTTWRGFPWLDIQTGIRATRICNAFRVFIHGTAFTPEFLGILLASLYDHQIKTEKLPMGVVHNKAIFEQRGFINIAYTFQEFKDARRWLALALERTRENLIAQTTADGVQREWSGGYHVGVLRDAVEIMGRMDAVGIPVPQDYRDRVRAMYDYLFAMATPDLGYPMFGDAGRPFPPSERRRDGTLYGRLVEATDVLDDPKYAARAKLDRAHLPEQTSYAFHEAGMYVLRNAWGPDQIYFALHCSPPAISGHDQPDNATFELYAYGHWLMPDTGFYTYGHDREARAWHRQTRVHQTLTLDGRDTAVAGGDLLWHTAPDVDCLVVENASYEGLTHRRTVWFVQKSFLVLLDEARGTVEGPLDVHFQLAPGDAVFDSERHWATTAFEDANVLIWQDPHAPVLLAEEEGWFAWRYGHRTPRKALRYRHAHGAPAAFLTLLVPYRGRKKPQVSAELEEGFEVGASRVQVGVGAFGETWQIGRDLERHEAWATRSTQDSAVE